MRSSLSIVVATYEWPAALDAVLLALSEQSDGDFDVVVADDGSGPETAGLAEGWKEYLRLTHVRQDDDGYRLARVRNLGAQEAGGEYLVFLNSDTVPRRHFVRAVRKAGVPGWFLAGKRLLLSRELSERVLADQVPIHRWSLPHWALHAGQSSPLAALTPRDRRRPGRDPRLSDGTSSARRPAKLSELTSPDATSSASASSTCGRSKPLPSTSSSKNDAPYCRM